MAKSVSSKKGTEKMAAAKTAGKKAVRKEARAGLQVGGGYGVSHYVYWSHSL